MIKEDLLGDGIGFIELVDSMGNDLTVVNSARVSFGKTKTELEVDDEKLISYLAKHKHWSPFRHVVLQFRVKAPEIVGRQFYKHVVGSDYTFKDHAWNEISGRYAVYKDEFYRPDIFRQQSKNNKQASEGQVEENNHKEIDLLYNNTLDQCYNAYSRLLELGCCKEQARGVLPVSFYTEWIWSASLQAVANFVKLRDDPHSQWEIRQYAIAMKQLVELVCPVSFKSLMENM